MGTMKLIALNGQEVKKIRSYHISVEDIEEMVRQIKAHENDPQIKFYDYPSMVIPEKRKPMTNADRLISLERR